MKRLKILEDMIKNFPTSNNQTYQPPPDKWIKTKKDEWMHLCFSIDDNNEGKVITKYINGRQVGKEIIITGKVISRKDKNELNFLIERVNNIIEKVENKNKARSL